MSAVADKLREAREYLVRHGWNRNGYEGPDGSVCMMGAVNAVVGSSPYDGEREDIIGPMRGLLLRGAETSVPYPAWWNDAPERTQAEVLAAFDKAIALAEEQSA